MEVSQFTYMQQIGGIECDLIPGEITYGLERLCMYIQDVKNVYDLDWNGAEGDKKVTYGDVFLRNEEEFSAFCLEHAEVDKLFAHFNDAETACYELLKKDLALPAYDYCLKASHLFNLLDARGVISVTERASYIARVRNLAKGCCSKWVEKE
jgi:glycyl-tRNA synthetase alpha chain